MTKQPKVYLLHAPEKLFIDLYSIFRLYIVEYKKSTLKYMINLKLYIEYHN